RVADYYCFAQIWTAAAEEVDPRKCARDPSPVPLRPVKAQERDTLSPRERAVDSVLPPVCSQRCGTRSVHKEGSHFHDNARVPRYQVFMGQREQSGKLSELVPFRREPQHPRASACWWESEGG